MRIIILEYIQKYLDLALHCDGGADERGRERREGAREGGKEGECFAIFTF